MTRAVEFRQGAIELLILKTLSWGPQHGFSIARWIQDTTDDVLRLEEGSLYPSLHRMEDKRWVRAEWGTSENNRRARFYTLTAAGRKQLAAEREEFERVVVAMLNARRAAAESAADDVTTRLLREQVSGRPLHDAEIVSILRNWTVGEIGTISASVGILAHYLAQRPELQQQLRDAPALLPAAIDEILRIDGPLLVNRRVATRTARAAGREFAAGERLSVMWTAANRDGRVFDDPDSFRLDRDPAQNLLYGAGIHVCPGAPLARMELRLVLQALLAHTAAIEPVAGRPAMHAVYPAGGYRSVPLRLHARPPAAADPR
jgi:transcriptional regulator